MMDLLHAIAQEGGEMDAVGAKELLKVSSSLEHVGRFVDAVVEIIISAQSFLSGLTYFASFSSETQVQ